MGDEPDSTVDWAEEVKWAKRRFWNMRAKPGSRAPRQEKQAEKDRAKYPQYQVDTVSALPVMIRFMVEVCGIPFAHAEAQAISDYRHQEKHQTARGIMFGYIPLSIPEDAEPGQVAKWLVARHDIIEALTFARIAKATIARMRVSEIRSGSPFPVS